MKTILVWLIITGVLVGAWFLAGITIAGGLALAAWGGFLAAFGALKALVEKGVVTVIPTGTPSQILGKFDSPTDEEE